MPPIKIMKAIQIDLFSGRPAMATEPSTEPKKESRSTRVTNWESCPRGTISSTMTLDPCKGCPLKEVCSPDDCGMKLYETDDPEENYESFEEWLSEPLN